ncbi:ribbon-helix-helix, copG family protein [Collimonas arenae]|uniref:Ribbon-helix-helix, copG family protein n=1 Tax=Collimonas arenae TaxID=279058 RepID=A0A127QH23_9BURK|nr:ribbon-helix-helix protein, CopG family [Collimonas arenae]AMO99007.1 ribbon-helix-helix, copG family protein [Collimonas arenae]AMP08902.1 ribbon-helix-helix, copG family protein [Collimonas arenae]
MRLSAKELATIEELADAIGRSRASFIRRLIVRGLEAYELDPRHTVLDRLYIRDMAEQKAEAAASISAAIVTDGKG